MSRVGWDYGIVLLISCFSGPAYGAASFGEIHELLQPDGTLVPVRIWGDEFYQVVESLEGYTLVRDSETLSICYAQLSPDGNELVSTGVPLDAPQKNKLTLKPHLRISTESARNKVATARSEHENRLAKGGTDKAQPQPKMVFNGKVRGLTILIDFPDARGTISPGEIERLCNEPGYSDYGNHGSVRDYYWDVSNGKLTYTNYVVPNYHTVRNSKAYYDSPANCNARQTPRIWEMILDALNALERQGFDFSPFDGNGDGYIDTLNVLYAGMTTSGWGCGLWPHTGAVNFLADNVRTNRYHLSGLGEEPSMGTFCHETGHVLLGWPDLYDYEFDSFGVGKFCLMGIGDFAKNPVEPCAYLKHITGWSATELLLWPGNYSLAAGTNHIYMIPHPSYLGEYFLLENRNQSGRDEQLPDSGLAIWHVDRMTGNQYYQQRTEARHYQVSLVQADGLWDMESHRNAGDSADLWGAPEYTEWNSSTQPNSHWWDDHGSGAKVYHIGQPGETIMFSFESEPYTTPVNINTAENFPDAKFRRVVEEFMEVVPGGFFTRERAAAVSRIKKTLDCPNLEIQSLQGIAFLSGLTSLNCSGNQLETLDLSRNPYLLWLECYNNLLTSVNITACRYLSVLDCRQNRLLSLDTSDTSHLTALYCQQNQIPSLQLKGKTNLKIVECDVNRLTELDVSACLVLERLHCSRNQIIRLELAGNVALIDLNCWYNSIAFLDLSDCRNLRNLMCYTNAIKSLNVSTCLLLEEIDCDNNQLEELILPKVLGLQRVRCYQNKLSSLDVNGCSGLIELACHNNHLQSLLLEGCNLLEVLDCQNNMLSKLEIPSPEAIVSVDCSNNRLHTISISGAAKLETLNCRVNQLQELDLSGCRSLLDLFCNSNFIKRLVISDSTSLRMLFCDNNQLVELNVSNQLNLLRISCEYNQITDIDVSRKTSLLRLDCLYNPLRRLNASYCEALSILNLSGTALESLDASYCPRMINLTCDSTQLKNLKIAGLDALLNLSLRNNQLASLDITSCPSLKTLDCSNNRLESLRINNQALWILNCSGNQLKEIDISSAPVLNELNCSWNALTEIDLSGVNSLGKLFCGWNQLSILRITSSERLNEIDCSRNRITTLDLGIMRRLSKLDCSHNSISTLVLQIPYLFVLNCSHNVLSLLDISDTIIIDNLDCSHNYLKHIELPTDRFYFDINFNRLNCSNNLFASLADMPITENLRSADIRNNHLASDDWIDVSILLDRLGEARYSSAGALTAGLLYSPQVGIDPYNFEININNPIDIPDANLRTALEEAYGILQGATITPSMARKGLIAFNCSNRGIRDLTGMHYFQNVEDLDCSGNAIESLTVGLPQKLLRLNCSNNAIKTINASPPSKLSSLVNLQELNCSDNAMESISVDLLKSLTSLNCSNNFITSLYVSEMPNLHNLDCSKNTLDIIDITGIVPINSINCAWNKIKNISIESQEGLSSIYCNNNQLTEINLSGSRRFRNLDCSYNYIVNIISLLNFKRFYLLNLRGNQLTDASELRNLPDIKILDLRDNRFDCGDWEDIKALRDRVGEPVYYPSGNMNSGFLYSPQSGLDPYDCDAFPVPTPTPTPPETAVENWTVR